MRLISYIKDGNAGYGILEGEAVTDLVDLVDVFSTLHRVPDKVVLAGPSEGGIVTVLVASAGTSSS